MNRQSKSRCLTSRASAPWRQTSRITKPPANLIITCLLGTSVHNCTETTMNQNYRIEKDSMGEMQVPADAYYGAQTARAVENFPISDLRFNRRFIAAMGLIKFAAAEVNNRLGVLDDRRRGLLQ